MQGNGRVGEVVEGVEEIKSQPQEQRILSIYKYAYSHSGTQLLSIAGWLV